jgi:hypothetical protein
MECVPCPFSLVKPLGMLEDMMIFCCDCGVVRVVKELIDAGKESLS